ncbi:MAG TPA: ABC transporter permease [Streptosporangiaceae bacterium]|nr:ABC transporter permease [Streptosporangiaceae bacterium]
MGSVRQGWLVAKREFRERGRSRAFLASVALMVVTVAAMLIIPALFQTGGGARDIGLTGPAPTGLVATIQAQTHAAGITARMHRYGSLTAGEQAVRQGRLDVLVASGQRLEWQGRADQQLKAAVTGAIQLAAVHERAAAAGIRPETAAALLAPVPISSVELGHVAGRSSSDETAVIIMTGVLFFCITIFGAMVLNGVLEEKASRVVEVLLARIPARALLAGKIAGIGLLGLAQIAVTALAALIAVTAVGSIDIPAIRGSVLTWAVVWFVLGYALYATVYGALGSLGSRAEDAQAVAGPVMVFLPVAYFAAFFMITQPASAAARAISYFPLTAPFAMPGRIAMGATAWWEPVLAVAVTLATIIGLVRLAGRLYTNAILHSGPALSLKDAWRSTTAAGAGPRPARGHAPKPLRHRARAPAGERTTMTQTDLSSHRLLITILTGIAVALGVAIAVLASDVILGVIAGFGFFAVTSMMVRLWTGHPGPPAGHH